MEGYFCASKNARRALRNWKQAKRVIKIYRGVEQLVARWAHNPKVACSSHAPATKIKSNLKRLLFLFNQILVSGWAHYPPAGGCMFQILPPLLKWKQSERVAFFMSSAVNLISQQVVTRSTILVKSLLGSYPPAGGRMFDPHNYPDPATKVKAIWKGCFFYAFTVNSVSP